MSARHRTYGILKLSQLWKTAVACVQAASLIVAASGMAIASAAHAAAPVASADARLTRSLMRLDPAQRFQQMCDVAAMKVIAKESGGLRPDRAMLDALSPVKEEGDTLSGSGGAIRHKGEWRQISFTCKAAPDRLSVLSFTFELGPNIPDVEWERYGLWR